MSHNFFKKEMICNRIQFQSFLSSKNYVELLDLIDKHDNECQCFLFFKAKAEFRLGELTNVFETLECLIENDRMSVSEMFDMNSDGFCDDCLKSEMIGEIVLLFCISLHQSGREKALFDILANHKISNIESSIDIGLSLLMLLNSFLFDVKHSKRILEQLQQWPESAREMTRNRHKQWWVFYDLIEERFESWQEKNSRQFEIFSLPTNHHPPIYLMGDSHIIAQAHALVELNGELRQLRPLLTASLQAFDLSSRRQPCVQSASFFARAASVPDNSIVLMVAGEIDCRQGNGIHVALKNGKYESELDAINATASDYVATLQKEFLQKKRGVRVLIEPVRPVKLGRRIGRCEQVRDRIRQFNESTAKYVSGIDSPHMIMLNEMSALMEDEKGFQLNKLFLKRDDFHTSSKIVELSLQPILNKIQI